MHALVPAVVTVVSLLLSSMALAADDVKKAEGKAAFEKLKSLAGEWEGSTGSDGKGPPANVVYRVASNGQVVMETLFPGTPHEMISMYHLAEGELVLTHYCSMGNQPRMKLDAAASNEKELRFAFVGGTNFDPAKDTHIHSGVLRLGGEKLEADWAVWKNGQAAGVHQFALRRKASGKAPTK